MEKTTPIFNFFLSNIPKLLYYLGNSVKHCCFNQCCWTVSFSVQINTLKNDKKAKSKAWEYKHGMYYWPSLSLCARFLVKSFLGIKQMYRIYYLQHYNQMPCWMQPANRKSGLKWSSIKNNTIHRTRQYRQANNTMLIKTMIKGQKWSRKSKMVNTKKNVLE